MNYKRKRISFSWKEYFNFSKREKRGALVLAVIAMMEVAIILFLRNYVPYDDVKISVTEIQNQPLENKTIIEPNSEIVTPRISGSKLFHFDPNHATEDQFLQLGLSAKQSAVIRKYLSKGGMFRTKKDVGKIYSISPTQFKQLEPFILLPDSLPMFSGYTKKAEIKSVAKFDLNKADSSDFEKLRGIGPVLAGRLVKYRNRLGGFINKSQVLEIYGLTDTLYNLFRDRIFISDTLPFKFIQINTDSFSVLASHPYIQYKLASQICNYRKQNGNFNRRDQLKALPLVNDEIFRKLAPYIKSD